MEVRKLPDHLRTEKLLFREIVTARSPDIPFATRSAIDRPANILRAPEAVALFRDELTSSSAKSVLPPRLVERVLANLSVATRSPVAPARRAPGGLKRAIKRRLRRPITVARSTVARAPFDYNVIALRLYIVRRMHEALTKDATALDK